VDSGEEIVIRREIHPGALGRMLLVLLLLSLATFALSISFGQMRTHMRVVAAGGRLAGLEGWTRLPWSGEGGEVTEVAEGLQMSGNAFFWAEDAGEDLRLRVEASVPSEWAASPRWLVRMNGLEEAYSLQVGPDGRLSLCRTDGQDAQREVAWAETSARPAQPHQLWIEALGPCVRVWLDGRLALEFTDPDPLTGRGVGIDLAGSTLLLRNFEVDQLAGG
jgi:hypothetical protein